jgi:uncharacterized alpha-E superfamily protein
MVGTHTMLSRVADAMFWMSRYIERAEHVARLLEVSFHLQLDLRAVAGSQELQWLSLLAVVQQPSPDHLDGSVAATVSDSLTFDLTNPSSIMTSLNRSRNNARSIRGSISSDMWRELNKLYWQLTDPEFRRRSQDSPHELYQAVQTGSQMFQGVCDATMIHDEGWRFIQLGKYLERAEKILRVLDTRHRQLSALAGVMELSLQNLHWVSVLKSCQAYQAYQQLYISRVESERVLEFLLFNPDFPYSVRYCLKAAAENLAAIGENDGDQSGRRAGRILGRMILDLEYAEPDEVLNGELHSFLETICQRCGEATAAVQQQYSLF